MYWSSRRKEGEGGHKNLCKGIMSGELHKSGKRFEYLSSWKLSGSPDRFHLKLSSPTHTIIINCQKSKTKRESKSSKRACNLHENLHETISGFLIRNWVQARRDWADVFKLLKKKKNANHILLNNIISSEIKEI